MSVVDDVLQSHRDLLERPLIAFVGTLRQDGTLQVNPMWFDWNGSELALSLTATRRKLYNLRSHSYVTASILDPV